jgi:hypothetical protein
MPEDSQGLLPGLPGPGQVAGGVAGVAEVGDGLRFMGSGRRIPGAG